jgi:hypothetical protein
MKRLPQVLLILFTLAFSWLAMQVVHELGHMIGAKLSGGRVARVVLHPLTISQTQISENPHPLFVEWMGPWVGVTLPMLAAVTVWWWGSRFSYLVRFFAGFCLIANGAYIGAGSFRSIGDAGDMLHHGMPIWALWLFGIVTVPFGLLMWNGLGKHFGLGDAKGKVDLISVYIAIILFVATIAIELAFSPIHALNNL